ncbi:hypothetical protein SKAU_G00018110 [Synaphobranchus kaupii]|uniref:Uncharacterized protein n=1 Tax=Synaphobranchus kaupii TaxID=118154 RepID=A0A9Q1GCE0_SYNKA|nr:hypothetical protein SKAU_G00018110 [Synaphobranchus kaupii]
MLAVPASLLSVSQRISADARGQTAQRLVTEGVWALPGGGFRFAGSNCAAEPSRPVMPAARFPFPVLLHVL